MFSYFLFSVVETRLCCLPLGNPHRLKVKVAGLVSRPGNSSHLYSACADETCVHRVGRGAGSGGDLRGVPLARRRPVVVQPVGCGPTLGALAGESAVEVMVDCPPGYLVVDVLGSVSEAEAAEIDLAGS